jgi:hypothetical protein
VRYAIKALQHGASEIAAGDDDTRDGLGMVATDPTKLKVRRELLSSPPQCFLIESEHKSHGL